MPQRPFRFLHAADLHLDQPVAGLADVPEHLVDLLIDCPARAAVRVFDAAIDQRVDFVLLAGGVIDPRACAAARMVAVGRAIRTAGGSQYHGVLGRRAERPGGCVAQAHGVAGQRANFSARKSAAPAARNCRRTGLRNHRPQFTMPTALASRRNMPPAAPICLRWRWPTPNWASECAGIDRRRLLGAGRAARAQHALRSCALRGPLPWQPARKATRRNRAARLHAGIGRRARARSADADCVCDVVRWHAPRVALSDAADRQDLEQMLRLQTAQLLEESGGTASLITWTIACQGPLLAALRRGQLAAELTALLRSEFGHRSTPAWTLDIVPELPEQLPAAGTRKKACVAISCGACNRWPIPPRQSLWRRPKQPWQLRLIR